LPKRRVPEGVMSRDTATFGAVLRQFRTAAALSQEALAERAGLSLRGISDLERSVRRAPHLTTIRLLADALELTPSDRQALLAAARPARGSEMPAGALAWFAPPPTPLTSLVGRERELVALAALVVSPEGRMVTLTGPGGSGKTRLALETGRRLLRDFGDGVVFVDLAPLTDAALVLPTIASTLRVREQMGCRLVETLITVLASKHLLLLLDNCEQVLDAATEIAELLVASPDLSIIATSREPLHMQGERVVPVPPLPVPAADGPRAVEELARVPSVALFVERATASHPAFALTAEAASAVAAICRRLDGLPLAIELAAARISVLSPAALLARLERRLPLLTGGARDAPARQRTLRDTIAWSYDLLTAPEQALFRRLAVFVGGFTLEGAEAVGSHDGSPGAFAGVERLCEQSLLRQEDGPGGEPRFAMLETVREFGLEQLAASSEEAATRGAHAGYFLALVAAARASFEGPGRSDARDQIEREHDNMRAALTWALASGDAETAQRLVAELARFWVALGYIPEGRDWLEQAVALDAPSSPETRVDALLWAANFAASQDTLARADVLAEDALALARSSGYCRGVAMALYQHAQTAMRRGDHERATALYEAALAMFQELDEPIWEGVTLRELGLTARARGDDARARHEEALAIWRRLDHPWGVPAALRELAHEALQRGDLTGAAAQYGESLERWRQLREPLHIGGCLWGLARIALATGRAGSGARLLGAASALDEALGIVPAPDDRAKRGRAGDAARAALGEAAFETAWIGGRALPLEEAIAEALVIAVPEAVTPGREPSAVAAPAGHGQRHPHPHQARAGVPRRRGRVRPPPAARLNR
jgi:predicted ATPase/transcriptional regulator with XRE-family HTH domain